MYAKDLLSKMSASGHLPTLVSFMFLTNNIYQQEGLVNPGTTVRVPINVWVT